MIDDIKDQLDRSDDPLAVILRAHLLAEVRLRDVIRGASNAPDELQEARLSFHQALSLARAIIGRQDESAWGFLRRLNEVRNRVAHRLEPGDLDALIGSVVDQLWGTRDLPLDTPVQRLRAAAAYACGYLDALRGSPWLRPAYTREDDRPTRQSR
jgi:hypothetical protein